MAAQASPADQAVVDDRSLAESGRRATSAVFDPDRNLTIYVRSFMGAQGSAIGQMPVGDLPDVESDHHAISAAFDPDFYLAVYTDLPTGMEPLWHYRVTGWREGRDPTPWFSAADYLAHNPDVAEAGREPFAHYLRQGRYEGRDVTPSRHSKLYLEAVDWSPPEWGYADFSTDVAKRRRPSAVRARRGEPSVPWAEQREAIAPEFDAAYYLAVNPDVAAAGSDPLDHFLMTGWLEGRDPSARFSVRDYLDENPDVAASGLNPFAHYVISGRAEGRAARNELGFRYDVIARLRPVADRLADMTAAAAAIRTDNPARLAAGLDRLGDLHVTFSHDDYVEHFGGLQMCVRRESESFAAMDVDHLHLYPATPPALVRASGEPGPLGVLLNGRVLGVYAPETVRDAVAGAVAPNGRRSFAVHSLLGHDVDATADILDAAGVREGFFWLHDFASLCAGFHLLRNDVEDCGAPPAGSAACGVCAYGPFRARHVAAHRRLFERLDVTVVAPSETTLAFWRAHGELPARRAVVLPHARLAPRGPAPKPPKGRPFRFAYLGMPTPLKGWPVFRDLANALAGDPRYEFLHLGGRPDPAAAATFHRVVVTGDEPRAMQAAVEALEIDAALVWPLCRETFSFIAYEAVAGGAAVVTGPDSGNVAAFASDKAVGRVLADEAALADAFATGAILALGRGRRRAQCFDLVYSGMSGDLVERRP